jgi:hypothetical protein
MSVGVHHARPFSALRGSPESFDPHLSFSCARRETPLMQADRCSAGDPAWWTWARRTGRAVMCWLLLLGSAQVMARHDFITEQSRFEDRSGALTFAQVQSQAFIPFSGTLALGFGASPVWGRLLIDPACRAKGRRECRITRWENG